MKIFSIIFALFICLSANSTFGQDKYFVFLKDKKGVEFNPYTYFDSKAIERRIKDGISPDDISDYPLNENYISEISSFSEETGFESRWLNMVVVYAFPFQIEIIRNFDFVNFIEKSDMMSLEIAGRTEQKLSDKNEELLAGQYLSLGGDIFEEAGIRGKGIRIAVFDVGFQNVNTHSAFSHIRDSGRIIATWDFIGKDDFVYEGGTHGRSVLSCIAGIYDGKKMGLATDAEFLLARTEYQKTEPFSEEENWLAAAEWADKNGADIINSSLGYTYHRYFTFDMNGHKSLVSRAANMAARKGILVVNSMGNDGTSDWKIVCTPADADSVLSIGAVDYATGIRADFSSYGPTCDQRRKPNVSAYGYVIAAASSGLNKTQGTSFSSPLVAGFAACALQVNPGMTNMDLFKEIEKSGNLYPYYDYSHGYGIPQAKYFISKETSEKSYVDIKVTDDSIKIIADISDLDTQKKNLLYYHIENPNGVLEKYAVIEVYEKEVLSLDQDELSSGQTLRVHFKGTTKEYKK